MPLTDNARRIWAEVRANQAMLDACSRHEFEQIEPGKFGSRWRCKHCGGEVNSSAVHWYTRGLEHGSAGR